MVNDIETIFQGIVAPFDAKAWERFRDWDPQAADYLQQAVDRGVPAEEIQEYVRRHGYSDLAVSWLGHAALWLHRRRAAEAVPEPAQAVARKRIEDAQPLSGNAANAVLKSAPRGL